MVSAQARVASERQELQGRDRQGSCALPTHLVEAVKAGQCRFVERKVSHCGKQERGGVSLGQGAAPEPRAVSITLCSRPWWSGHQWPWWALAAHVLSCQLPQVSWLIHRSSLSIEKHTLPGTLPPRSTTALVPSLFPLGSQCWPCCTMDRLLFRQLHPRCPQCRLNCRLRPAEPDPQAQGPNHKFYPSLGPRINFISLWTQGQLSEQLVAGHTHSWDVPAWPGKAPCQN